MGYDFKKYFTSFAGDLITDAYREFKKTDQEYQETVCYLNNHSKRFDNIISGLNEEDTKFIEEYMNMQAHEAICMNENLYMAGYRDCVKLLKELSVL